MVVNLALGLFVLIGHSGALALIIYGKAPEFEKFRFGLMVSIAVSTVVVISAIFSLVGKSEQDRILKLQSMVILVGALLFLGVAGKWVLYGLPSGVRFSWIPGMFTAFVTYSVYLFRRTSLLAYVSESRAARECHIWAGLAAVVLDLGVTFRLVLRLMEFFDGFRSAL